MALDCPGRPRGLRALNHRRPLDLISTDVGARMVEDLLGQIDHGVFT
jgi:uncharacterized protein (DUF2384 family)